MRQRLLDIQIKWLERTAELLVLRRDTLRIIDRAWPLAESDQASGQRPEQTPETPAEQVSSDRKQVPTTQTPRAEASPIASVKGAFSGVVPISLKRFEQSGVARVECPSCGRV
jgi:hypothetical protein